MRLLLVGWDGAEPSLIADFMAQGQMPNLERLAQGGLVTRIASTVRPESATAWATLLTASTPTAHGVFSFAYHIPGSYHTRLHTTAGTYRPYLWEQLSEAGLTSVVINAPMTYPPRPLRGALVCGQMTPSVEHIFTYPADLSARLRAMDYPLDAEPPEPDEDREEYLARMEAQVARRTEIALDLLQEQRWDFALVAYTELDRLQHFFWADMDAQHPAHARCAATPRTAQGIMRHYQVLDRALDALLETARPDLIILVSDHGFGPCSRKVFVNAWLQQLGLFVARPSSKALGASVSEKLYSLRQWRPARIAKQRIFGERPIIDRHGLQAANFVRSVDWRQTRAWFSEAGGIRINLAGREPEGIVRPGIEYEALRTRLIKETLDLRDPLSGLPIFALAEPREALYPNSPHLEAAPDIILDTFHPPDHALQNHIPLSGHAVSADTLCADAFPYTATHNSQALLVANRPPDEPISNLADVGRWVLRAFGIAEGSVRISHRQVIPDANEDALLRARLRALGYMD